MRTWIAVFSLVVLATIALARAQRPPAPTPTFHAAIDYVEFPVRVVDGRGNVVRDLSQSDFRIVEDGKPQTIETFRMVEVKATGASAAPSPQTAVITNAAELGQAAG